MIAAYFDAKDRDDGHAVVVCAPPGTGKTHAAATLLSLLAEQSIPNAILVTGHMARVESYQQVLARELKAPSARINDLDWLLARKEKNALTRLKEVLVNPQEWLDNLCGSAVPTEAIKNQQGECPPVLILDDFNSIIGNDIEFVGAVAKEAIRNRLLLFVLSNDELTASTIVDKNSDVLQALPTLRNETHDGGVWVGAKWSRLMLTQYLELTAYSERLHANPDYYEEDKDGNRILKMVEYAMTPLEAERAAHAELAGLSKGWSGDTNSLDGRD